MLELLAGLLELLKEFLVFLSGRRYLTVCWIKKDMGIGKRQFRDGLVLESFP